jgi:hypothetical protein
MVPQLPSYLGDDECPVLGKTTKMSVALLEDSLPNDTKIKHLIQHTNGSR